jgi:LmbE family N-acetylglucosaminyl deacetylase
LEGNSEGGDVAQGEPLVALAAGAHPDDIEFMMAGTLLLLKAAGARIHMWSISDGSLGSPNRDRQSTAKERLEEARASARFAGAEFHEPIAPDMGVTCDPDTVARASAVIRKVRPRIIFAHSPADYHPDHEASSRLVVAAAFVRGVPRFSAEGGVPPWDGATTIYHALPYGLLDPMRKRVRAGQYVNTGEVMPLKRRMLSVHASQAEWLRRDLGIDYIAEMERMSAEVGRASGRFEHAEGWRRRLHLGLSPDDSDPLSEAIGPLCWTDPQYEESL